MAFDEGLAERVRGVLAAAGMTPAEKKMFGGLSFLIGGNKCCGGMGKDPLAPGGPPAAGPPPGPAAPPPVVLGPRPRAGGRGPGRLRTSAAPHRVVRRAPPLPPHLPAEETSRVPASPRSGPRRGRGSRAYADESGRGRHGRRPAAAEPLLSQRQARGGGFP